MPDPREIAEQMIADAVEEIEFMSIGEAIDTKHPDLADDEDAFDDLRSEVDRLIHKATITVTWPESPGRVFIVANLTGHDGEADHG